MIYKIAAHSDVGIVKKTNQDSVLVKIAQTNHGKVCLCVVCDGMGGLADGELASATVIREFDQWFINKLPGLLETPEFPMDELRVQWDDLVMRQNKKLATERLLVKLSSWTMEQAMIQAQENWVSHNHLQRGNPVKVIQESLV